MREWGGGGGQSACGGARARSGDPWGRGYGRRRGWAGGRQGCVEGRGAGRGGWRRRASALGEPGFPFAWPGARRRPRVSAPRQYFRGPPALPLSLLSLAAPLSERRFSPAWLRAPHPAPPAASGIRLFHPCTLQEKLNTFSSLTRQGKPEHSPSKQFRGVLTTSW